MWLDITNPYERYRQRANDDTTLIPTLTITKVLAATVTTIAAVALWGLLAAKSVMPKRGTVPQRRVRIDVCERYSGFIGITCLEGTGIPNLNPKG